MFSNKLDNYFRKHIIKTSIFHQLSQFSFISEIGLAMDETLELTFSR